ncbi:MAG: hypothetical protein NZ898_02805 [Myxococcota bacterium]|nr:hypothetical protein [Myxococcota bacterium]
MQTEEPNVSGAVVLDQTRVMEEIAGRDAVARALGRLPREAQEHYASLTPAGKIPAPWARQHIIEVARELDVSPSSLQAQVVRRGVERTLRGPWRLLLRFTSDEALVARTPLLYRQAYDRGRLTARITAPGRAELEVEGWDRIPRLELEGLACAIETVLRCAGRPDVQVVIEERPRGAFFVATWRR